MAAESLGVAKAVAYSSGLSVSEGPKVAEDAHAERPAKRQRLTDLWPEGSNCIRLSAP